MKHRLSVALAATLGLSALGGCSPATEESLPLWEDTAAQGAQRIVVISDIHLGVDDSIAETVENRALLIDFLERAAASDLDELVIAGDFLDDWFLPATYEASADAESIYRAVKDNNAEVFEAFEEVMASGTKLTYVPGNHDLMLDEETLAELLPGIEQARDVQGLGTLRTGARSEIVVEHGHRYDAGATPDSLSNAESAGDEGSILPFGYFLVRMIVTSVVEGKSAPQKELPAVSAPVNAGQDQLDAYAYYKLWSQFVSAYPIAAGLDEPIFDARFAGYDEPISLSDLVPTAAADGTISAHLYPNLQQRWDALQKANGVSQPNPFAESLNVAFNHLLLDAQAPRQHFDLDERTDVVVFGHSHVPLLTQFADYGRPKTYANAGTWIDHSLQGPTGTFVAIESGAEVTEVRVLQYLGDGKVSEVPNPE